MNNKFDSESIDKLYEGIACLRNKEECRAFFEDLCTINEILSMAQRFEVANMLHQNLIYTDIEKSTGASSATISRVNRCLNYGTSGYRTVIERLNDEK